MGEATDQQRVSLGDVWHHASRFFTRIPIALLGTWFALTVGLIVLVFWEDAAFPSVLELLEGGIGSLSIAEFLILLLVVELVSLLRTGLLLPARIAYRGGHVSWSAVIRMAFDRFLPLLDLQLKIGFGLSVVGIVCIVLDATVSTWVFLPIIFVLQPANYYVAAHQMSAGEAIRKSFEVARNHWIPIFVVFGSLTCLSVALPSLIQWVVELHGASSVSMGLVPMDFASKVGRSTLHIGADFVGFVLSCGLYFALDER